MKQVYMVNILNQKLNYSGIKSLSVGYEYIFQSLFIA